MRWPRRRVAFSMPMTRTPMAMGSRVPAWPTRRVCARRRTRATTSCEVMPPGLSTMTRPGGQALVVFVVPVVVIVFDAFVPVVFGWLLIRVRVAGPLGAFAGPGQFLVLLAGGRHQVVDPLGVFRQRVGDEREARGMAQADETAHLGADDPGGALERL